MTKFRNYDLSGQLPVLSWNPIVMRCPGCELSKPDANGWIPCWHIRMCNRMMHNPTIPAEHREVYAGRAPMRMHPKHADEPLGVRKGRVICAQFMGDLGRATPECRADVLRLMELTPWHKYLVLTKWPEYVTEPVPDNVWVGTTVTDQDMADMRIPKLLRTTAKNKWLSVEPILGPIDVSRFLGKVFVEGWTGKNSVLPYPIAQILESMPDIQQITGISFVACGPETGTGARKDHPPWTASVQVQCEAAGVTYYDKREGYKREWPAEWKDGAK